jgi:hypothetical protein
VWSQGQGLREAEGRGRRRPWQGQTLLLQPEPNVWSALMIRGLGSWAGCLKVQNCWNCIIHNLFGVSWKQMVVLVQMYNPRLTDL